MVRDVRIFTGHEMETLLALNPHDPQTLIARVWDMVAPEWRESESFSVTGHPCNKPQITKLLEHWLKRLNWEDRSSFLMTWCNYGPAAEEAGE